ncbi:hypothetical protein CTA2_6388 [Colletotrichum tanaceti]|uniref:C2H2-type domain-containing protein n=1 Tax=Colletotrichum tanaceti TaxID=1306861 RepID=A0A4U6XMJ8_9PEZI|nr:hypothetical protein CTA2_6389 [Colletotrichum tanaceti]KAJ0166665.1 hypothetical protein CTA2_6388 [Colletotrichum tanaceti]TKW56908.1 hypothetical protein CTA1_5450 [Colletotrichum tanaceti]
MKQALSAHSYLLQDQSPFSVLTSLVSSTQHTSFVEETTKKMDSYIAKHEPPPYLADSFRPAKTTLGASRKGKPADIRDAFIPASPPSHHQAMPFPQHALYLPASVTSDPPISTSSQVKVEEVKVPCEVAMKTTKLDHKAVTRVGPTATSKTSSKASSRPSKRAANRPARKAVKNTTSMASSKAVVGATNRPAAKNTVNIQQHNREEDTETEDDEMEQPQEREDRPGLVRIRALNKAPGLCYTDEKGKKRWPCNLCSRHWSRKDETRAHLRRVHYAEHYPEGFDKARGLKQAQLDCP